MNLFLIDYAFGNCVIYGYSFLRATSGVSYTGVTMVEKYCCSY